MENSPPGLSGTSHAIVALAANGEQWHCSSSLNVHGRFAGFMFK